MLVLGKNLRMLNESNVFKLINKSTVKICEVVNFICSKVIYKKKIMAPYRACVCAVCIQKRKHTEGEGKVANLTFWFL